jgi:hypothetical protein
VCHAVAGSGEAWLESVRHRTEHAPAKGMGLARASASFAQGSSGLAHR